MQGLMYRLAELDADSAGMVRVIDYFDALVRHGADVATLTRAGATLAGCVAGIDIRRDGSTDIRRCTPHGEWSPQLCWPPTAVADVVVDDVRIGRVWLERQGDSLPLDAILVDRMALTAAMIVHPRRALSAADHVTRLLFPSSEADLLDACSALSFGSQTAVRVVSATGLSHGLLHTLGREHALGRAVEVRLEDERLLLCSPSVDVSAIHEVDNGARIGVSFEITALNAHRHLGTARFARSRATRSDPVVSADQLGALTLLGPNGPPDVEAIPDVARLISLRATPHGDELVDTLRAYVECGNLRSTANRLHLHHSSVGQRLAKLSSHLQFPVDSVKHRARAHALMMVLDSR